MQKDNDRYILLNDSCIIDNDTGQVLSDLKIICSILNSKEKILNKQLEEIIK